MYLTFDDGPNEGTPYVLDALKEVHNLTYKILLGYMLATGELSNLEHGKTFTMFQLLLGIVRSFL